MEIKIETETNLVRIGSSPLAVILPAVLKKAGWETGQNVRIYSENGKLVIENPEAGKELKKQGDFK